MSTEYWEIVADSVLDEVGLIATSEQVKQMGKRLADASSMEAESCGHPGGFVDQHVEVNPLQKRVDVLQRMLDAMSRKYGVSVDADRMEIQWHGHVGGTVFSTQREKLE